MTPPNSRRSTRETPARRRAYASLVEDALKLAGCVLVLWFSIYVVAPFFSWAWSTVCSTAGKVEAVAEKAAPIANEVGEIANGLAERATRWAKSTGNEYHLVIYSDSSYSQRGSHWTGPYGSLKEAREGADGHLHYEILLKSKDPNSLTGWDSKYR